MNEVKEFRESIISQKSVESSLRAFFVSSRKQHLENKTFTGVSVEAILQVLSYIVLFHNFDSKEGVLIEYITFNNRQSGELEIDKH